MGTLVEIETVVGQLGESGEYWMGRRMSGLLSIQSSKVVPLPMSIKASIGWVKMNNLYFYTGAYEIYRVPQT
jgi:hypothetical protein